MGNRISRQAMPTVLVAGLEGAGKTTLISIKDQPERTLGTEIVEKALISNQRKLSLWDVSGNDALRPIWPAHYKNIRFNAVIYVVDATAEKMFEEAKDELHILTNEEELRETVFIVIFNTKGANNVPTLEHLKHVFGFDKFHTSVRIEGFLIDVKSYDRHTHEAFTWLYNNLDS